jgi:uncharacterized alpha-E superfamily protein
MTRDDGWRLLSIGRHVERLAFLAKALASGLSAEDPVIATAGGFNAMLALFDSTITFRAQFQQSQERVALLALLLINRDNPRSLSWVIHTLRGRLSKLAGCAGHEQDPLAEQLPNPAAWDLTQLCPDDASEAPALLTLLAACQRSAYALSDAVGTTYFSHTAQAQAVAHSLTQTAATPAYKAA